MVSHSHPPWRKTHNRADRFEASRFWCEFLTNAAFAGGNTEVEDEQCHGDGEDAVTESGETLDTLSGNTVVERWHRSESSGLPGRGQSVCSRMRQDGENFENFGVRRNVNLSG